MSTHHVPIRAQPVTGQTTARFSMATEAIHADNGLARQTDLAMPIHVSTTFSYPRNPDELQPLTEPSNQNFVYSRESAPNTTRLEAVLSALLGGPTLTYSSGVSAIHAYLVFLKPRRVAISGGFYGTHEVLKLHQKLTGCEILSLDRIGELESGDVVHLETPVNPTGEAMNIRAFAELAHSRGAYLFVDSTFGPPGLQDPIALGSDLVMHSGTKYFGGHHDLLCGTLTVPPEREEEWFKTLWEERSTMGSVLGSMEGWLGLRSLRTLALRVPRQSENANRLVSWIDGCLKDQGENVVKKTVHRVTHASLQEQDMDWLTVQMPNGFGAVFAIEMQTEEYSKRLPSKLQLFQHATSLGGVESQIEWRKMVDKSATGTLLRLSIGVEDANDLQLDLLKGFQALTED